MYKISKHASEERLERFCYLMETLGIGEEVCVSNARTDARKTVLTSTGIVLVLAEDGCVITAYIATMKEAVFIWHHSERSSSKMPTWLYNRVLNNKKYWRESTRLSLVHHYHEEETNHKFF